MHTGNIKFKRGNIFDSDARVITNTVNTVGVMGAGLARQFKERFPEMFVDYQERCRRGEVRVGRPYLWKPSDGEGKWVLNFPTKEDWKKNSRLEWIEEGLRYLLEHYEEWGIQSLAMPALGCNLGGLDWKTQVKPLMVRYLSQMKIPVEIYLPLNVEALLKIAEEMLGAGMKDRAEQVLEQALQVAGGDSKVLAKVAQGLAKVGKFDQAQQVAGGVRESWWRVWALAMIAEEMAGEKRMDEARQVCEQALQGVKAMRQPEWRSRALVSLIQAMAKAEMFDQALRAAEWIEKSDDRSKALAVIAREMAKIGMVERAGEVFDQALKELDWI